MVRARLRDQCRAKLADLEVPRPFSIEALCDRIADIRGRPLHLHPFPSAQGLPCGMWVSTADADHIFHAQGASALHQRNIILHEIGHMLWDHSGGHQGTGLAALLTDLDPAMVRRVLMRTRYSTPEEKQAEMMAALILEEAGWTSTPRPDGLLGRLSDAFGVSHGD